MSSGSFLPLNILSKATFGEPQSILISVHVPKTGGTSFQKILRDLYGEGFREDYAWTEGRPSFMMNGFDELSDEEVREAVKGIQCIHGHFAAKKYKRLRSVDGISPFFVTWLRDPVERAISTYFFLRGLDTPEDQQPDWERKAKTMGMLEFFKETPYGSNRQSAQLREMPISAFSFIGIMEQYQESIELFLHQFSPSTNSIDIPHELQNRNKTGDRYQIEEEVHRVLIEKNEHDFRLYQAGLDNFKRRIKSCAE